MSAENSESPEGSSAAPVAGEGGGKPVPTPRKSATAARLAKLGLRRPLDLVLHLPLRYEDETRVLSIAEALASAGGVAVQVEGIVRDVEITLRGRRQMIVRIADESGELTLRFLNFYASQQKLFAQGAHVRARGEIRSGFLGDEMVHPVCKPVEEGEALPQRLTPVYPATAGISQAYLRKAIAGALQRTGLPETLPDEVLKGPLAQLKLRSLADCVRYLHAPPPSADQNALCERHHPAWLRIKFDELLAQQLSLKRAQAARRDRTAPAMPRRDGAANLTKAGAVCGRDSVQDGVQDGGRKGDADHPMPSDEGDVGVLKRFLTALPFELTGAQRRVCAEISADLASPHPMQRLLQGDVGSGKTIVAAIAAAQAIDAGYQAALMAPTEILAEQHFRKLKGWLEPLGVRIAWLAGSMKAKEKRSVQAQIAAGDADLVIGTHALVQQGVDFARLGLSIVDEQHRFGVDQRLALRKKTGDTRHSQDDDRGALRSVPLVTEPHQLMMSATPIPRTLAMTYYADLDVSVIDELPPGRTPVVTRLINDARRGEVIERVRAAAQTGRQVYWVCPLIEESEALQLQTAVETFETLQAALPELTVGLVHGRLPQAEKAQMMAGFQDNAIHVLVATTVIEVGVDVPNASLMVIEHAERFGLAQLHQLRGRVGRGAAESVCALLYQTPLSPTAKRRLQVMRDTTDGFEIARQDLEIRGPGEFLGARQSGEAMLRFADLQEDAWLVELAQAAAMQMLTAHPAAVEAHLARWMGVREQYLKV